LPLGRGAARKEKDPLKKSAVKMITKNKKARYDYEILSTHEAGLVLLGTEIKSIREGRMQLKDGYARIDGNEAFLHEVFISPYPNAGPFNHEPTRPRKLLLHKREIRKLFGKVQEKGLSLVPLSVYLKNNKAKVELGLGKGKRKYEKRESIKKQDAERDIERTLRRRAKET
jgi:SsrA-binding protein